MSSPAPSTPGPVTASSRRAAIFLMIGATTLFSIAGAVTRHLHGADSFEVAFWRSLFCGLSVLAMMAWQDGGRAAAGRLRRLDPLGWLSGAMLAAMFTCFMLALTRASTANVLVINGLSPLVTAVLARSVLGIRVAAHTSLAIALALGGIVWMFGGNPEASQLAGAAIAFAVPFAAAVNLVAIRRAGHGVDLMPAIAVGGLLSALVTLPFALPLRADAHDIALLALLGAAQLAIPFVMYLRAAQTLAPAAVALLGLNETLLGPVWAWLWAGETPAGSTLAGGALVLAALAFNEGVDALRGGRG